MRARAHSSEWNARFAQLELLIVSALGAKKKNGGEFSIHDFLPREERERVLPAAPASNATAADMSLLASLQRYEVEKDLYVNGTIDHA